MSEAEKIQNDIDIILVHMSDDLETQGYLIENAYFNFLPNVEDTSHVLEKYDWDYEYLERLIKLCNTRSLVKHKRGMHRELLGAVELTEEGQSRALSVKHGKNRSYELGSGMQIAALTVHGAAQIGNGNVQNINDLFRSLSQRIELMNEPDEKKQEVLNLINILANNPLVQSLVL